MSEIDPELETWKGQVRKGLLEYFIFSALRDGESYGYEILQSIRSLSSMHITESAVYPILARSAKEGLMKSTKRKFPTGPIRQYYELTPSGRVWLAKMSVFVSELGEDLEGMR